MELHTCHARCDEATTMEFSGAQRVRFESVNESKEILDSGSTVTLSTRKDEMRDLKSMDGRVVMSTNNGEKGLDKKENWEEWGETYLCESTVTDIVSVSDAVAKGFRVVFEFAKDSI